MVYSYCLPNTATHNLHAYYSLSLSLSLDALEKMAIYTTRKEKIEQNVSSSLVAIFVKLVKSRILIDYHYYEVKWCLKVLCEIVEEELLF